ncbi:MAG: DUF1249 domain-containing protein [Gammaproteobacteria bacterium]|nr:DUF1249 domain-containing protein [Gammaproteobacteria bacterium]
MSIAIKQLQQIKDSSRGFGELMSLYEDNYVRFRQLVQQLDELEGESRSIRFDDVTLHLQIIQRSRYTTTVLLTYLLNVDKGQVIRTPDLKIRIYHDAHQAEVMSCCRNDPDTFQWLEKSACQSTMQWRWRMNQFLHKWLNHCLKFGHGFPQEKPGINWSNLLNST